MSLSLECALMFSLEWESQGRRSAEAQAWDTHGDTWWL